MTPTAFPDFWPPEADPSQRGSDAQLEARSAAGPAATPAMRRAEETTRVAKAAIDADTDKRVAQVARLKAARLAKEAVDEAEAATAKAEALKAAPAKRVRKKA